MRVLKLLPQILQRSNRCGLLLLSITIYSGPAASDLPPHTLLANSSYTMLSLECIAALVLLYIQRCGVLALDI